MVMSRDVDATVAANAILLTAEYLKYARHMSPKVTAWHDASDHFGLQW
jgi:hypothetical protein